MVKNNRRENWQVTEGEEIGESSSIGDKLKGKQPEFGMYGSGVKSPIIDARIHGGNAGNERRTVVQITNGVEPEAVNHRE